MKFEYLLPLHHFCALVRCGEFQVQAAVRAGGKVYNLNCDLRREKKFKKSEKSVLKFAKFTFANCSQVARTQ